MLYLGQGLLELFVAAQAPPRRTPSDVRKRFHKGFQLVWAIWRNPGIGIFLACGGGVPGGPRTTGLGIRSHRAIRGPLLLPEFIARS